MQLVEVEITGMVITAQYGALSTGAILRTDAEFAKHLVDDCHAAKYTQAKAQEAPAEEADQGKPPKRAKKTD